MTRWRQPWISYDLDGRRIEIQVLDPATAFELEPQIIAQIGEAAALTLASPMGMIAAAGRHAWADDSGQPVAVAAARGVLALARDIARRMRPEPAWMLDAVERLLFERVRLDGALVVGWRSLDTAEFGPVQRWTLVAISIAQTFADLWTRAPYDARAPRGHDYGVPQPNTPLAVAWAAALAREGYASGMAEILDTWTPLRKLEAVELLAEQAAIQRARDDAAAAQAGGR